MFEEFLSVPAEELFRNFFLPFIVVFVILWAALEGLGRFSRKVNTILALFLTIAAAYGGLFTWFSTFLVPLGAYTAMIAFALVFVVGIAIWAVGRTRDIYYESGEPFKKLQQLYKKREKLWKEFAKKREKGDEVGMRALDEAIKNLDREIAYWERQTRFK